MATNPLDQSVGEQRINELLKERAKLTEQNATAQKKLNDLEALTTPLTEQQIKEKQKLQEELAEIHTQLQEINSENQRIAQSDSYKLAQSALLKDNIAQVNLAIAKQRADLGGVSSIYGSIATQQQNIVAEAHRQLEASISGVNATAAQRDAIQTIQASMGNLASVQQKLAAADGANLAQHEAITAERVAAERVIERQLAIAIESGAIDTDTAKILQEQLTQSKGITVQAEQYASVSKETKDRIQSQVEAYNKMKNAASGMIDTVRMTLQTPQALAVAAATAFKKVATAALDVSKKTGEFFSEYTFQTGILGFIFDDAVSASGKLAKNLGDSREVTMGLQTNILAMGTAFGIGGDAAADLFNQSGKLSGNTNAVAKDMMEATAQTARMNGVLPAQMMGDMAKNTEGMMLYAKGSYEQFTKNALAAGKLGVELSALNSMSKTLLDFESSIESELELNAMLGKEINLNRARELAYMGKQDEAAAEMLRQVGGINELRKMDVFQMEQLSKTTGLTVEQLGQMVANGGKLSEPASEASGIFDGMSETTKGLLLAVGGPLIGALTAGLVMWGGMSWFAGKIATSMASVVGSMSAQVGLGQTQVGIEGEKLALQNSQTIARNAGNVSGAAGSAAGATGIGASLISLAAGLTAMGTPQVLFGALNLIPTGLGFLLMVPGLPALFLMSKMDLSRVGVGLTELAIGLGFMGVVSVTAGAGNLALAGIAFAIVTIGIPGMAAVALLGTPAGVGLASLGTGLTAMSTGLMGAVTLGVAGVGFALMTPGIVGLAGVAALGVPAGIGLASLGTGLTAMSGGLIGAVTLGVAGLGFALMTLGLPGMIGVALLGVPASVGLIALTTGLTAFGAAAATGVPFLGVLLLAAFGAALIPLTYGLSLLAPVITSIAQGIAIVIGSLGQFLSTIIPMMSVEAAMGVLAFAGAFLALGFSLLTLGIFGSVAIPTLLALSVFMLALGGAVAILDSSFASLSTSVSTIGETLSTLASSSFTPLFGLASALSELANSLFLVGLAGILALPVLNGLAENPLIIGAGGGEKKGENNELLNEIRGLRSDLLSGKIAVYMDGEKVTAAVAGVNEGNPLT